MDIFSDDYTGELDEAQKEHFARIREKAAELWELCQFDAETDSRVPTSRELALARTALQESLLWTREALANYAIKPDSDNG